MKINLYNVWWFLAIAVICSLAAWIVMCKANDRLEATHNTIITHQQSSINSIDSLLKIYWRSQTDSIRKTNDTLTQQLNSQLIKIAQSAAENSNSERITNLLESELSKIQNEYEVLNLWCALLTVVFLIFSFFSIFKANEMANQSEESLKNIRIVAREVQSKSDSIDEKIRNANERIDTVSTSISTMESAEKNLSTKYETLKDTELSSISKRVDELKKEFEKLPKQLEKFLKDCNNNSETRKNDFNLFVEKSMKDMDQHISQIAEEEFKQNHDNTLRRLVTIEKKIKDLQSEISELTGEKGEENINVTNVIENGEIDIDNEDGLRDVDDDCTDETPE